MKRKEEIALDESIRDALIEATESLAVSPDMKQKIHRQISASRAEDYNARKEKEVYNMRHWSVKKIAVLTAAICLVLSTAVLAAGKYKGLLAVSSADPVITTYAELQQKAQSMGMEGGFPESFQNGYVFKEANIINVSAELEDGSYTDAAEELKAVYTREGMPDVNVFVRKKTEAMMEMLDGIADMQVARTSYKFVPVDYEITPEEQTAMEEGKLEISYGTSEVEEKVYAYVQASAGELQWSVASWDSPLEDGELLQMIEEAIQ